MNTVSALGKRLYRHLLLLVAVMALLAAFAPSAAFAASAGETMTIESYGRGYSGRRDNRNYRNDNRHYNYNYKKPYDQRYHYNYKKHDYKKHDYNKKYDHKSCRIGYSVKKGDTLSKIAKKHHTTVYSLAKQNGIKNANRIYAGQRICIR